MSSCDPCPTEWWVETTTEKKISNGFQVLGTTSQDECHRKHCPPPRKQQSSRQELPHPPWIGTHPLLMFKYTDPKLNIPLLKDFSLSLDCLLIGRKNTQPQNCLKQLHHISLPKHLMPPMLKEDFMACSMSTWKQFKIMEELQSLLSASMCYQPELQWNHSEELVIPSIACQSAHHQPRCHCWAHGLPEFLPRDSPSLTAEEPGEFRQYSEAQSRLPRRNCQKSVY